MADAALTAALIALGAGRDLSAEQAHDAFAQIIAGSAEPAQVAAFLTALRFKGECFDELAGAVRAVRARMTPLEIDPGHRPILDTCGTGGDGANSVNVSTATAIVAAACGARVAKHGNRSASGNSGSAEVLAELGVAIEAEPAILRRCLEDLGITFLFAPRFHPALRHVAAVRKLLPFRTLFNLVGPLANPARPDFQLLGVPDQERGDLIARTLTQIDQVQALVVNGEGGLDEVSLAGATSVRWVAGRRTDTLTWRPSDFGLPTVSVEALRITGPTESANAIRRLLAGERGPIRDVVLANVAACLRLTRLAADLPEGVARGAEALDSGTAERLLDRWAALSRQPD